MVDDRHDSGKSDGALRRPVNHAGGDSAGLGDQRQIFRSRHVRGKARVETDAGHHDAQTIRSDQPHTAFLRRPLRRIRQRTRSVTEPGTDNDRAHTAGFIDESGDRACRSGDDDQFRRKIQFSDTAGGRDAVDLGIARIDEAEFAFELGFANIIENGAADRAMARAGSDERDRTRRKQVF